MKFQVVFIYSHQSNWSYSMNKLEPPITSHEEAAEIIKELREIKRFETREDYQAHVNGVEKLQWFVEKSMERE